MSYADYGQRAEDHQSLLVLVSCVGSQLKSKSFSRLFDRISRLEIVPIVGQQRTLHLRYKQSYPLENNEWGDFQAHRKVLGMVCLGRCRTAAELSELYAGYDEMKQQYASTLFDSRLIIFGLSEEGNTLPPELRRNSSIESDSSAPTTPNKENIIKEDQVNSNITDPDSPKKTSSLVINTTNDSNHNKKEKQDVCKELLEDPLSNSSQKEVSEENQIGNKDKGNAKETNPPTVIFYPSTEESADLEEKLREFAAALYWVLESKRLDRSQERQEKLPLLMTPFEKKDFVGIDTDSRWVASPIINFIIFCLSVSKV